MGQEKAGCVLGFLNHLFNRGKPAAPQMPKVQINKFFLSDAERSFFHVLRQVVGERALIFPQVSLQQLLFLPGNEQSNPGRGVWQNRIRGRSLDFVLCEPKSVRPLVAIELEDSTHARPQRQTRDEQVQDLLQAAGLPLVQVLTSRSYDTRELAAALLPHLNAPSASSAPARK